MLIVYTFGKVGKSKDPGKSLLAMCLALFCIDIKNLVLAFR